MTLDKAIERNHNIYESSVRPVSRNTIYEDLNNLSLKEMSKKYNHDFTIRNYLGFLKRRIKDLII